jgi:hypothetical protein
LPRSTDPRAWLKLDGHRLASLATGFVHNLAALLAAKQHPTKFDDNFSVISVIPLWANGATQPHRPL